ncbi:MAG: hypothetical protein H7838_06300 [Magnetococcus sp. DMHC-8]
MTETTDPSAELAELKAQRRSARTAYKKQKQTLRVQIKSLKEDARRARKIKKLESRLDASRQAVAAE